MPISPNTQKQLTLPFFEELPEELKSRLNDSMNPISWDRILKRIGVPLGTDIFHLGMGGFGNVFDIGNDRALKITLDGVESASARVLKDNPMPEAYHVYDVFEFKDSPGVFGIVMEKLFKPDYQYRKIAAQWVTCRAVFGEPLSVQGVKDFLKNSEDFGPKREYASVGEWLLNAARGFAARGIVDADFHTGNVMARKDGSHCIIDIGGASKAPRKKIIKANVHNISIAKELLILAKILLG